MFFRLGTKHIDSPKDANKFFSSRTIHLESDFGMLSFVK